MVPIDNGQIDTCTMASMAESIRVAEGWRRKALIEGLDDVLHRGVNPDTPALQTAFQVVCDECKDLLPCGSTLAVASGRVLEARAKCARPELEREEFRLMVRCLRYSGVLYELPGVCSERMGLLLGVPAEYGALEAYDYSAHDGTLHVTRRGAVRPRVVTQIGVPGGVTSARERRRPFGQDYLLKSEIEVRALYSMGLKIAPILVYAYGPTRCRQVRRWAARRAGTRTSAALVFAALTKYRTSRGAAFDAEASLREMKRDLALDEQMRTRDTVW